MKKKRKFLELHERLLTEGLMNGLCREFKNIDEEEALNFLSKYGESQPGYWAFNGETNPSIDFGGTLTLYELSRTYTPLRQTIVLFCAVINDEL